MNVHRCDWRYTSHMQDPLLRHTELLSIKEAIAVKVGHMGQHLEKLCRLGLVRCIQHPMASSSSGRLVWDWCDVPYLR